MKRRKRLLRRPRWRAQRLSTTTAERARTDTMNIAPGLWKELLGQLERRGAGQRESGAFLLARRIAPEAPVDDEVIAIAYYDDLDAHCLTGGITMSGTAYDALWKRCREEGLRVVADVHTHPSGWVQQSSIDRANPMMAQAGHLALIVGNYGKSDPDDPPIGAYRYLGDGNWQVLDRAHVLNLPSRPESHVARMWPWSWGRHSWLARWKKGTTPNDPPSR